MPELSRAFAGGPSSTSLGTGRRALAKRFPENDHNVYPLARALAPGQLIPLGVCKLYAGTNEFDRENVPQRATRNG